MSEKRLAKLEAEIEQAEKELQQKIGDLWMLSDDGVFAFADSQAVVRACSEVVGADATISRLQYKKSKLWFKMNPIRI